MTNQVDSNICFKVINGNNKDTEYNFHNSNKQIIKFGRKKKEGIDVVFNDDATSRLQCT